MNEKGSVTVTLIALLPFLTAVMSVTLAIYLLLSNDARLRHACRTELLRAQSDVAKNINALFELNPQATRLRLRLKAAQAKAAATIGTPAHAAALAELQFVIRLQLALALEQKRWLTQARLTTRLAPSRTSARLHQEAKTSWLLAGDTKTLSNWRLVNKPAVLTLDSSPKFSLTPDYQAPPGFSEMQKIRLRWSMKTKSLLPAWMRLFIGFSDLETSGSCSATLKKEGLRWRATLTHEGRP